MTDELKAETEKLQSEVKDSAGDVFHWMTLAHQLNDHITALQAEIDRLREVERAFNFINEKGEVDFFNNSDTWYVTVAGDIGSYTADTLLEAIKAAMGGEGE